MTLIERFAKNESGATAIEYGLIAGLIAVIIIANRKPLKHQIRRYCEQLDLARNKGPPKLDVTAKATTMDCLEIHHGSVVVVRTISEGSNAQSCVRTSQDPL